MIIFRDKPTTEELCNTLMGSKAAIILRNNLHQVPEYGYCKGKVNMIVKGFLKDELMTGKVCLCISWQSTRFTCGFGKSLVLYIIVEG